MNSSAEHTGRKIMFKNILLFIGMLFFLPLLMVFILNSGREDDLDYLTFYKNVFKSVALTPVSIFLQIAVLSVLVYFIGGSTGRKVINEKMDPFKGSFIALNLLWFCLFLIAMINEIILAVLNFGFTSEIISGVVVAWLIYGSILFLITSLIFSAILSIFVSRGFKRVLRD